MAENAMEDNTQAPEVKSHLSEGILNALRQLQDVPAPESTPSPQSKWHRLRAQLRKKPVDADGWMRLVDLAEDSGDIEKIKNTYEGMLETCLNTVRTNRVLLSRACYDFALGHAGQDKDSYEIWQDYINFLKAGEPSTTWEEQQRMDAVRRAYQQAVQNNLNKITAKKFISDLQENHMQTRTVLNQLQEHLTALVARWRLYLKWEEGNPLEIEESNWSVLLQRVQSVYKKAIVRMRFYSEIWYMPYAWTNSVGKTDEALALLKAGIDANPASFVLNFAYAEALELQGNFTEVHATFEKFLETLRKDLEALESRVNCSSSSNGSSMSNHSSFNTQSSDEKPPKNKELCDKRTDYGIAWIAYIRSVRRAEDLKFARNIYGKAGRDRWTPWDVHEAEALMEYQCGNKDVASRIFEKAMELYGDEVEFVLRYLGFLISINDENNARALFERAVATFRSPNKVRPLWERWSKYEYHNGDLAAALKLERRLAEVYPNGAP
ncbi:hypothetical protein LXA43DRAFT_1130766 [Ganoderma leucocontextum]|nr:hypothetical protein LXA43DRAFT_1130766 [Ganoderma leucocontextum]